MKDNQSFLKAVKQGSDISNAFSVLIFYGWSVTFTIGGLEQASLTK